MTNFSEIVERTPKLLVVFQGDVNRIYEGHIVGAMCKASGIDRPAYSHHEATDKRPEERIYFYPQSDAAREAAEHIGNLIGYNGLSTCFVERAGGIHLPPNGGVYLAEEKLVVTAPDVALPIAPKML